MKEKKVVVMMVPALTFEEIGPAHAAEILEKKARNRRVYDQRVRLYTRQMLDGQWRGQLGDPIRFDTRGLLIDGQHRLWALIESGTTQTFAVVRGLSKDIMPFIDKGRPRSVADDLTIMEETNANVLAGAIGILATYERIGILQTPQAAARLTSKEALDFLDAHPTLREAAVKAHAPQRTFGGGHSRWAAIRYVLDQLSEPDADEFFNRLVSGDNLKADNPILTLRNRLIEDVRATTRLRAYETAAFVFKTWNAWRRGDKLRVLRYRRGGANPEAFPIPN